VARVSVSGWVIRERARAGSNDGPALFLDVLVAQRSGLPAAEARRRAIGLYGLTTGCLQVARATNEEALSQEILAAATVTEGGHHRRYGLGGGFLYHLVTRLMNEAPPFSYPIAWAGAGFL